MASLLGNLIGPSSGGLLSMLGGPATPDPLAGYIDAGFYDPNDQRAQGFSDLMLGISERTGNPQGHSDLANIANIARGLGTDYDTGIKNYLHDAAAKQADANTLWNQKREKELAQQEDLDNADIIAQHPDWAGLGPKELQKVYADFIATKEGIAGGTGEIYGAGSYVQRPDTKDPKKLRWWRIQPNLRSGGAKEELMEEGFRPPTDPDYLREKAQATAEGRGQGTLNFKQPEVQLRVGGMVAQADRMKSNIQALFSDKGLSQILGPSGLITDPDLVRRFSPDAARARARYDAIVSQYVTDTLTAMRNASASGGAFGNVTNYEDQLLKDQAALSTAQSPADFQAALRDLYAHTEQVNQLVQRYYQETYGEAYQAPAKVDLPPEMTVPEAGGGGTKRRRWNRETGQMEEY